MKFWGNLIIIVVTAIVSYLLGWGVPLWISIISGLVILWCWTTIYDKIKQHNADLEELEEDTATIKQLLNTSIKDAWDEKLREIEIDIGTNRAPIFWEKFFERRDIINAHRAKTFNLSEVKRKLQTNRLIFGETVCVELPPKEKISAWFRETDSVFDKMEQRVLENPIFHAAYIAVKQTRKQDAHNQRMESIARKTERNTAAMTIAKVTKMATAVAKMVTGGATTVK